MKKTKTKERILNHTTLDVTTSTFELGYSFVSFQQVVSVKDLNVCSAVIDGNLLDIFVDPEK